MALIMVISTGDFQIRWNTLSLSFSEKESGKRPLGLSDFYHNYLIILSSSYYLERYPFATPNLKDYLCSNMTFLVEF